MRMQNIIFLAFRSICHETKYILLTFHKGFVITFFYSNWTFFRYFTLSILAFPHQWFFFCLLLMILSSLFFILIILIRKYHLKSSILWLTQEFSKLLSCSEKNINSCSMNKSNLKNFFKVLTIFFYKWIMKLKKN